MRFSLFMVLALATSMCDEPKEAAERPHPGCPGESSRSAADPLTCSCRKGQVMFAGSLECADCDPSRSQGLYCDCGKNGLFSFDATLEDALGLRSPQVECGAPADCPDGEYLGDSGCTACGPLQCGETCGVCAVGETCVSGSCVAAAACRVIDVYPPDGVDPSECRFREREVCGLVLRSQLPVGVICACENVDLEGCYYEGMSEALSK